MGFKEYFPYLLNIYSKQSFFYKALNEAFRNAMEVIELEKAFKKENSQDLMATKLFFHTLLMAMKTGAAKKSYKKFLFRAHYFKKTEIEYFRKKAARGVYYYAK